MAQLENLRTASLYINNQLLCRGLLRDGHNINFTHPGDSPADVAVTMGQIMAVVNDLILRRDRDAEHRENLSTTLRATRAESLRQVNDIQRLQEKHTAARRKADIAEASEASLRTQLKTAEATVLKLKDEAARTKTLVSQTRSACANEVRKRDRQIDNLKKAASDAGRARGTTKSSGITTITVSGDWKGDDERHTASRVGNGTGDLDLRTETNAFLAELAKSLSEDNHSLLQLVQSTMSRLKEMSGWNGQEPAHASLDGLALPTDCLAMSEEMNQVLDHLRTILTNPSFVPIEEVMMREDEINRLRDGWVKMEARWKEAVHLIDGWRNRMQTSGRPVNVEELKMGLRLSPVRVRNVEETAHGLLGLRPTSLMENVSQDDANEPEGLSMVQEEPDENSYVDEPKPSREGSLHLVPAPEVHVAECEDLEPSDTGSESSIFEDDIDPQEYDVSEPNIEVIEQSVVMDSPPMPPPPQLTPLGNSSWGRNRGRGDGQRSIKHVRSFTTIMEENTREASDKIPVPSPLSSTTAPPQASEKRGTQPRLVPPEDQQEDYVSPRVSNTSLDSLLLAMPAEETIRTVTAAVPPKTEKPTSARERAKARANASPTVPANTRGSRPAKSKQDAKKGDVSGAKASAKQARAPAGSTPAASVDSTSSAPAVPSTRTKSARNRAPPPPTPTPKRSPLKVNSRLPLPRNVPPPQQSPLTMATIAAKLAASEREADAARVRAKLKAARLGKGVSLAPTAAGSEDVAMAGDVTRSVRSEGDRQSGDPVKKESTVMVGSASASANANIRPVAEMPASPVRKQRKRERRTGKAASRRRSTLDPWELQTLIQGNMDVPSLPEVQEPDAQTIDELE